MKQKQTRFYCPEDIKEHIRARMERNGTTFNEEIVKLLNTAITAKGDNYEETNTRHLD